MDGATGLHDYTGPVVPPPKPLRLSTAIDADAPLGVASQEWGSSC